MSDDPSFDIRLANGRFAKGNPDGPGRPHAVDRARELDRRTAEAGPNLIDSLLGTAKASNLRAMEMVLDRIWPVRPGSPIVTRHRFSRFSSRSAGLGRGPAGQKARRSGLLAASHHATPITNGENGENGLRKINAAVKPPA